MPISPIVRWYRRLPTQVQSICESLLLSIAGVGALVWLVAAGVHGHYYAASFAAVFSLFLGTICYLGADGKAIRRKVSALLGLCVAFVVFFGAVHYSLFLVQPDLYSFSNSIKEGKLLEDYDDVYGQALNRSKALYILALAHGSVDKVMVAQDERVNFVNPGKQEITSDAGFVVLEGTKTIRFRHDQLAGGRQITNIYWIDVRSGKFFFSIGGDVIATLVIPSSLAAFSMHQARSSEKMRLELERLIDAVRDEREQLLVKVRGLIEERPEWNVVDFIYFATVTFTTLGYGDILPNSTLTRLVVMLNAVLGVFFAAFALVVLWPVRGSSNVA